MRLSAWTAGGLIVLSFLVMIGVVFYIGSWSYPGNLPRCASPTEIQKSIAVAITSFEKSSYRNNPGALEFHGQEGAILHPGGRFAEFETLEQGERALSHQVERIFGLRSSSAGYLPSMTITQAIALYANLGESPTLTNYATHVAQAAGTTPDSTLEGVLGPC